MARPGGARREGSAQFATHLNRGGERSRGCIPKSGRQRDQTRDARRLGVGYSGRRDLDGRREQLHRHGGQTTVDISSWTFANLTVTPPLNFTGDFKLTVNATATDHATLSTGDVTNSKTESQTIDFLVAAPKGAITD